MAPDKNDLIPSDFVKILFDQVKQSSNDNTEAINELTTAIEKLTGLLTAPPTKEQIFEKINEHDKSVKENTKDIEKEKKNFDIILSKHFENLNNKLDTLSSKLKTVLIVISVVFSLSMTIYLFVKSNIEYEINKTLNKKIEVIIDQTNEQRTKDLEYLKKQIIKDLSK